MMSEFLCWFHHQKHHIHPYPSIIRRFSLWPGAVRAEHPRIQLLLIFALHVDLTLQSQELRLAASAAWLDGSQGPTWKTWHDTLCWALPAMGMQCQHSKWCGRIRISRHMPTQSTILCTRKGPAQMWRFINRTSRKRNIASLQLPRSKHPKKCLKSQGRQVACCSGAVFTNLAMTLAACGTNSWDGVMQFWWEDISP